MRRQAAVRFLAQVVLALVVMFLGWGLDDLSGFFANSARAVFVILAVLGTVVALVMGLDVQTTRRGQRPVGRQKWLLAGLTVTMVALIWFLPYADRRSILTIPGTEPVRWVGFGLYTLGTVVVFAALKTLGKMYSGYVTLQDEHKLVQTGIYGVIRHPIYLRLLLVALGLPLVFRSWLVAPLFLFAVFFAAKRIRDEEKLLGGQFGEEYEAYRRRTWRLIPYL